MKRENVFVEQENIHSCGIMTHSVQIPHTYRANTVHIPCTCRANIIQMLHTEQIPHTSHKYRPHILLIPCSTVRLFDAELTMEVPMRFHPNALLSQAFHACPSPTAWKHAIQNFRSTANIMWCQRRLTYEQDMTLIASSMSRSNQTLDHDVAWGLTAMWSGIEVHVDSHDISNWTSTENTILPNTAQHKQGKAHGGAVTAAPWAKRSHQNTWN